MVLIFSSKGAGRIMLLMKIRFYECGNGRKVSLLVLLLAINKSCLSVAIKRESGPQRKP